jgi:HK97 family phage major capsid protein
MKNIKQLIQDETDTKAAITKLKKEGRTLAALKERTPEQVTRYDAIFAELDTLDEKLEALQADLVRARRLQDDERASGTVPAIEVGIDHNGLKPWANFGEYLSAVAMAAPDRPGRVVDPRLLASISGASGSTSTDGGFLIRADWSMALMNKIATSGVLAPQCWTIPIGEGSDGLEAPYVNETSRATGSRWGGVQVYRAAEAASVTSAKPTFGKFELRLDELKGLFYATDRLLRDSVALEAVAMKAFSSEFAFILDDEIVRGTGVGQCLGVTVCPALVTVAKEGGQAAQTIVAQNVLKMYARLLASKAATAKWYINQEVLPQLFTMSVPVGVGGQLVYMPPAGLAGAPYGTLLGLPVIPIEQASGLGTVGDIMLLSLADDYILINKAMSSASSMHVRFIFDEMTYRWTYPIVGRPILQSAITPYKATTATTLSPFVTLAAR